MFLCNIKSQKEASFSCFIYVYNHMWFIEKLTDVYENKSLLRSIHDIQKTFMAICWMRCVYVMLTLQPFALSTPWLRLRSKASYKSGTSFLLHFRSSFALLHGPSMFAVNRAMIHGVLYKHSPALSLLMKHLVTGQRQKTPNFSAFRWVPHGSLVFIGKHFVTTRVLGVVGWCDGAW